MGIEGIGSGGMQAFGAAVVSETMDTLNNAPGSAVAPSDSQTFGASVVSKTLQYMNENQNGFGGSSADFDFQTSVLGAAFTGKGTIVDSLE